ncbi:MAG: hypothetical protein Aurels2KO_09770 [Aureliella sp.]
MYTASNRFASLLCLACALASFFSSAFVAAEDVCRNETLTLSFTGPETSEQDDENPFTNYRLDVTFRSRGKEFRVRGFYAADGNAAHSGADSGNVWQVRFAPPWEGKWRYHATMRSGRDVAINQDMSFGDAVALEDSRGEIVVSTGDFNKRDLRRYGRLTRDGHYYRQGADGPFVLKTGANSPENLLAYEDFDGTFRMAASQRDGEAGADTQLHHYKSHGADWRDGDPTWKNGKGKSIIGAVNYLANAGMNSVYFLTMNIEGDGKDVWPFASPDDFTRFDCSKLDQWEILFEHMQQSGIILHVITQETENEKLLDDGDTGRYRQLYYSELIARFAHHPALIWNLGEENGPANFSPNGQTTAQRKAMSDYLKDNDPYSNTVLLHTHSSQNHLEPVVSEVLGHSTLDGLSLQVHDPKHVHDWVVSWRNRSAKAGQPWAISMDEIGPAARGALPDADDPEHNEVRSKVLWGSLMAGASGVEWYFGYKFAHNDLGCEDWRSRDKLWGQTEIAKRFFEEHIPFADMQPSDESVSGGEAYCLAQPGNTYAVYRHSEQPDARLELNVSNQAAYRVRWYNPRQREGLQVGSVVSTLGGEHTVLGLPPHSPDQDWVVLVERIN